MGLDVRRIFRHRWSGNGRHVVAARTVLVMRVAALIASIAVLWTADGGQASAQGGAKPAQPPFIARGLTGAPEGAVVVSGEPTGGYLLVELRIKERQKVGKGE